MQRLVVIGLGNPGRRYVDTRHNLGFMVLDRLASHWGAAWEYGGRSYDRAVAADRSTRFELLRPQTYVNRTGAALRDYGAEFPFSNDEIVVVCDDIALVLGRLRLRRRGSDGGHNGLRSIIDELGTMYFPRLRLGVGPVPPDVDPADFVLSGFEDREKPQVERLVCLAVSCVIELASTGVERAMSVYNVDTTRETD